MTAQNHKPRDIAVLFYFIVMAICAKQALCLINEKLAVEPTMPEHLSSSMTDEHSYASLANYTLPACGTKHFCMDICILCHDHYRENIMECLAILLDSLCLTSFHTAMRQSNEDWCIWGNVSGLYSNLSMCTEDIADCLLIPWPNPLVEQTFLNIHEQYFQDCQSEELSDPPPAIVFALVITPICLIPVMVSLVVLKTKNGDGSP